MPIDYRRNAPRTDVIDQPLSVVRLNHQVYGGRVGGIRQYAGKRGFDVMAEGLGWDAASDLLEKLQRGKNVNDASHAFRMFTADGREVFLHRADGWTPGPGGRLIFHCQECGDHVHEDEDCSCDLSLGF